ncbi:oligopeptide transporter, OPT family [Myxococcota bacterium]|nr:oligopeptide transporter, OPT family [Myxococcota bacterium]MBU1379522.1 oligopeptide transporter, OPT family [Myxococcota bacterium]MBU1497618.1 oligopeptide transporter, OPT family [Myxococcota bacterium]
MEHNSNTDVKVLPESAYRPLNEGEKFIPYIPADKKITEISPRVFVYGILFNIIFTFAAAYLGLLTGNVIEAAIPIAILAVFLGKIHRPQNTISENVMIQSIGAGSGVVVAGVVFTLPALYINKLNPNMLHIIVSSSLGGFLGILLLIPLRRYFVSEMHGQLPFPEATATAEIIASGEAKGRDRSGIILLLATGIGAMFDFLAETAKLWNSGLHSTVILGQKGIAMAKHKITFGIHGLAAFMGIGYIVGLRYAAVIAAGSLLSFLVLIPLVYYFGQHLDVVIPHAPMLGPDGEPIKNMLIRDMSVGTIFKAYVQPIGIGALAMAGFLGIIKMSRIIFGSFSLGIKAFQAGKAGQVATERTDTDIDPKFVLLGQLAIVIILGVFYFFLTKSVTGALVAMGVTFVFSFLFTAVAARAIAIVGTNPVSGMTLMTLIISSLILIAAGMKGTSGQYTALIIGCAVCTALSTAGGFITDLKIGYWVGVTPKTQQTFKFLGILVASLSVGVAMWLLATSYGFVKTPETPSPLAAPQGKLMATIISSMMSNADMPYLLYGLGAIIAIILEMAKVPALAFALGMYLPISINLGVLAGGFTAFLIGKAGKTPDEKNAIGSQGTLIASGLMAGAALIGIVAAVLQLSQLGKPVRFISVGEKFTNVGGKWIPEAHKWFDGKTGQYTGLIMFIALGFAAYFLARLGAKWELQRKAENEAASKSKE